MENHLPTHAGGLSDKEKALAAISYIGPLFILSYILAENSTFVKFHAKQAMVFVILAFIVRWVLGMIFWSSVTMNAYGYPVRHGMAFGGTLMTIVSIAIFILAVAAIIKAAQGEKWEMPVVSAIVKKLNF